jgi:hypothetical protein
LSEAFTRWPVSFKIENKDNRNNSTSTSASLVYNDLYNCECILPISNKKNKENKEKSGVDETVNKSEMDIDIIKLYYYKLNLLKLLRNENVSDLVKLEFIDKYYILYGFPKDYTYNLYAGGLLDDWF